MTAAGASSRPLGAYLRQVRRSKGYTQAQLAARAFVSSRTIGEIESGAQARPRSDTLGALELALDLPPATLCDIAARAAGAGDPARPSFVGREDELTTALRMLQAGARVVVVGPPGAGVTRFIGELERRAGAAARRRIERGDRIDPRASCVVLRALTIEQSRALFTERARSAVTGLPPAVIDELCESVDRRPATIVHLTRQIAALGPHADARTIAVRATHVYLFATYDRIRAALTPAGRRAFAILGLFERFAEPSALDEIGRFDDVGTVVAELRDALVLAEPSGSAYAIPHSVAAYARNRLRGDLPDGAESRLVRWCVRSSAAIDAQINADTAREVGAAEARIGTYENAIRYAEDHGALDDAMRIGAALWYYFWTTSRAAHGLGILRELIERYERDAGRVPGEVAAEAYARAASLAHNSSSVSLRVAARWTERAVALFHAAGRPKRALHAMIPGCSIHFELGDMERSRATAEAALELAREIGDESPVGIIHNNLGTIYEEIGDFERALESYRAAAALFTLSTPTVVRAYTLANIGAVQTKLGFPREALEVLRSALASARAADAESAVILALREIGETYVALGRRQRAARIAALALDRAQALDATYDVVCAAETLAHAVAEAAPEASAALYGAVDALRLRTDRPRRPPAERRRSTDFGRIAAALGPATLERRRLDGIAHGLAFGLAIWRHDATTM